MRLHGSRRKEQQSAANKPAASAAALVYVKFQAVVRSAASAASLRGGRASGRLDHGVFCAIFGRASGQKIVKMNERLNCCCLYIGIPVVRSEIGGSGSEKELCTLPRSKP